jgi:predicted O-linked N-acetylglucosamine transferase (SPINDLY family)
MGFFGIFGKHRRQATTGDIGTPAEGNASALIDQGNRLEDAGDLVAARKCYEQAVELMPGLARAHLNLGNVMLACGQPKSALEAYHVALALDPDYPAAHYNMGNANARLRNPRAAMACYLRALSLKPDFTDAHVALGNAQEDLQLLGQAEASYRSALQLQPGYTQVYSNLGFVLSGQKKWAEALGAFRQAASQHYAPASAQVCYCASQLCEWRSRIVEEKTVADMIMRGVADISPFTALSMDSIQDNAAVLQRLAARRFAEDRLAPSSVLVQANQKRLATDARLRIGYLSADFHDHATMHLLRGVLAEHDNNKFAIHGYSYGRTSDYATEEARRTCESFSDLKDLSDLEAASAIAGDEVDILVDLKGFTQGARVEISALRPAPLLVNWLGYPGTLGHPQLADYIIGDPVVTPLAAAADFSETLALMPNCYQPNDRAKVIGGNPGRLAAGLPEHGFVFCSFNQSFKFNPGTFDVWCRLMREIPASVLWLLSQTDAVTANLRSEAEARGVEGSRLIFAPRLGLADHLGRLQLADLALDTFPYNSHTTASDALWVGVPLVTLMGRTFASRVGASLLNAAGVPECAVQSWDDYFSLAKCLAWDSSSLRSIRQKLVENRLSCHLFDTVGFTRDLERLYLAMWEQHQRGIREIVVLQKEKLT